MTLPEIDAKLAALRLLATELNTEIASQPKSQTLDAKKQYAATALEIAQLKNQRHELVASKSPITSMTGVVAPKLRVANLLFPKSQRAQYFATDLTCLDLLTMLEDVYEDDKPILASIYVIPEDEIKDVPPSWYELEPDAAA